MLNVPQTIRNQIAPLMQSKQLKAIMEMKDEDQSDQALLKLAAKQVKFATGIKEAWVTVAPLLIENQALTKFTAKNPNLKLLLPEVLTIQEALQTAKADYMLDEVELENLAQALSRPLDA
jgi:hypothetical protein